MLVSNIEIYYKSKEELLICVVKIACVFFVRYVRFLGFLIIVSTQKIDNFKRLEINLWIERKYAKRFI